MASQNVAAWIRTPKGDLEIGEAPYYEPDQDEILIKNEATTMQPFDARVRKEAYITIPYPFILGNTIAGTIVAVGAKVTNVKTGDRVVSDTPTYITKETKYGGWQKYVVTKAALTAKIGSADINQAAAVPFALSTAVGALQIYLKMGKPGETDKATAEREKVLIWGAGTSVGAYAIQYARNVGYTVIATASPRGFDHLRELGASQVLDYKSPNVEAQLRELGPFKFMMTSSGDPASQQAIGRLLQPDGGKFASTLGGQVELPENVERIYESYESATQRFPDFGHWWYSDYLPKAIGGAVEPAPIEKRSGGLAALQAAGDDVVGHKTKNKIVINPQE